MVLANELPRLFLTARKPWTDSKRLDTAATALLLANEDSLVEEGREGFHKGRYRIDSKLVADLYAVLPKRSRLELMFSRVAFRLAPKTFRALFLPVYRQRKLNASQRLKLAQQLWLFLGQEPGRAEGLRDVILGMLRSKRTDLSVLGLGMAGDLNYLDPKDLRLMKHLMLGKKYQRYNACNGFLKLVKRRHDVHPSVIEFCLQPEISQIAERIYKKDRDNGARRWGYYLLKALHRAGGPIAPGKKPYAPELDPPIRNRARRRRARRAR